MKPILYLISCVYFLANCEICASEESGLVPLDATAEKQLNELDGDKVLLLHIPGCKHCAEAIKALETLAKENPGKKKYFTLDCTKFSAVCKKLSGDQLGYPNIRMFRKGEKAEDVRRPYDIESLRKSLL